MLTIAGGYGRSVGLGERAVSAGLLGKGLNSLTTGGFSLFNFNMSLFYMLFTFAFAVAVVVDKSARGYFYLQSTRVVHLIPGRLLLLF